VKKLRESAEWKLLFGAIWRANAVLAGVWWGMVVFRSLLPAALAVAIGSLISAVQRGAALGPGLVEVGIVFVLVQMLSPIHQEVGNNLGSQVSGWLNERLLRASLEPGGMAHLETAELADEFTLARDFDLGITGPPLSLCINFVGNGFAELGSGFGAALVLGAFRWWAPVLVGGAWLATHVLLRESAVMKAWNDEEVRENQRHADYAYRFAVDAPAAKELRVFGLGTWAVDRFALRRRRLADIMAEAMRLRQRPVLWTLLLIVSTNAFVFWSLARAASTPAGAAGHVSLGAFIVFAQTAIGCSALGFGEFDWWLRTAAQPVPVVLGMEPRMREIGALANGTKPADGLPAREIRFRDVRFAYKANEEAAPVRNVLDGLDLTIPAGTSMAIVGQNGAGKTTLVKLLCRLYDPVSGAIEADGVDIRELDLASWRRRVAAVFQDFVRYELPLRDNVAPNGAPDAEIQRALERAGATGLADLDTILSRSYEGGTDLSGGQWQRVALARALCAVQVGAGVVILDEPTAQLDVRGEAEIFDRILKATRGCTTILISHRFSTVRHADRIAVVEGGRVVEIGSHDELMAKGGRYHTMFELQASRFAEGLPVDDEEGETISLLDEAVTS
jgi:ABC-type multidrug transport system fused ATPase/permease subunit